MSLWPKVREELNTIVNRHFETPEYRQLFAVKLTAARQAIWDVHYPHYIKSRRDCWGAAAVKAPLDVKRAIWEHEKWLKSRFTKKEIQTLMSLLDRIHD